MSVEPAAVLDLPGEPEPAEVRGEERVRALLFGTWRGRISVAIIGLFVWIERRVAQPLLPMRVVLDRTRAGSYLAVATVGAGMFGAFLFLTYYMQETLGFSPFQTGLAFLPMVVGIVFSANLSSRVLLAKFGPRPVVPTGMLLAMAGMPFRVLYRLTRRRHAKLTARALGQAA